MNSEKEPYKSLSAKKTDVEAAGLSGQVKQLKQICYKARRRYSYETGRVNDSDESFSICYNTAGNITEYQTFSILKRHKYIYNAQGFPIEESYDFWDDDIVKNRKTKEYDAQGNVIEEIDYDAEGNITRKYIRKYDNYPRLKKYTEPPIPGNIIGQGNMIEEIIYYGSGAVGFKTIYKYNDRGQMLDYLYYDGSKMTTRQTCKYDNRGNIIEDVRYNSNITNSQGQRIIETPENVNVFNYKSIWEYNDKGDNLGNKNYDGAGKLMSYTVYHYIYNKEGFKTEYTIDYFDGDGKLGMKSFVYCNEKGDVIRRQTFHKDGTPNGDYTYNPKYDEQGNLLIDDFSPEPKEKLSSESEEYVYDHHNNWIKKTTFYDSSGVSTYKRVPVLIYLREISYYGEDNPKQKSTEEYFADFVLEHAKEYNDDDEYDDNEETIKNKPKMKSKLTPKQAQWLIEASPTHDYFNHLRYYALVNNDVPSVHIYTGPYIEATTLLEELTENMGAQIIHSYSTEWDKNETLQRYTLIFPNNPGYLLFASQLSWQNKVEFEIPSFITDRDDYEEDYYEIYCSQIELFRPSDASGKRGKDADAEEREFEYELESYISKCTLRKKPDKPTINIVEVRGNNFAMVEHPIDDDFEIKDLNLNYGEGFGEFHSELMRRFNTETKGLVLFHGEPGTGKTYYIRHLLRTMTNSNKVVVYMPPNMAEYLAEPNFMTFLHGEVRDWAADGLFSVLLIEDAEPLLALRQLGARVQGITNLLNMSDGLLNDMLNMQIICTFNVELEKLDEALLRPGRLIARKEFKRLPEFEANLLAQRLGIKHHFTAPATLAEIYDKLKNKNILVHEADEHND